MVTLKDIADRANVSLMTVSRVVNGQSNKVSKKTANRVQKIINELGYIPNYSARSLSSKNSKIIVLILQGNGNQLHDPYNSSMVTNIIPYLQSKGYYTLICSLNSPEEITQYLKTWRADGAIFIGVFDEHALEIKKQNDIPLIFTDNYLSTEKITNIGLDDYKAGVIAATKFIESGHKNFAFLSSGAFLKEQSTKGQKLSYVLYNRYLGFKETLEKSNLSLPLENCLIEESDDLLKQFESLSPKVTAIFASSDILAIKFMDMLTLKGYSLPQDISIIGIDNIPLSYYVTPKLTTIEQDLTKKSRLACELLLSNIEKKELPSQNITLDVKLIERNSVKNLKLIY